MSAHKRPVKWSGFTLIEVIVVVAIIGILASIAMPKYANYTAKARLSAAQAIAGNLASASAANYPVKAAGLTGGSAVTTCDTAANLISYDSSRYTISLSGTITATNGRTFTCLVTDKTDAAAVGSATVLYVQ